MRNRAGDLSWCYAKQACGRRFDRSCRSFTDLTHHRNCWVSQQCSSEVRARVTWARCCGDWPVSQRQRGANGGVGRSENSRAGRAPAGGIRALSAEFRKGTPWRGRNLARAKCQEALAHPFLIHLVTHRRATRIYQKSEFGSRTFQAFGAEMSSQADFRSPDLDIALLV